MISELKRDLPMLTESTGEPRVSMYMPTYRVGNTDEMKIRFKNLLSEGRKRLIEMGMRAPEADRLLDPAQKLLADRPDFWQRQSDGLALFASSGLFKHYQLPMSRRGHGREDRLVRLTTE